MVIPFSETAPALPGRYKKFHRAKIVDGEKEENELLTWAKQDQAERAIKNNQC